MRKIYESPLVRLKSFTDFFFVKKTLFFISSFFSNGELKDLKKSRVLKENVFFTKTHSQKVLGADLRTLEIFLV